MSVQNCWYLRTQNVPQIRCINCNIRTSCLGQFSLISILLNINKASKHCACRRTITNAYGQCIEKDEFSKLPLSDPQKLGLFTCSLEILLTNVALFLEIYLGVPLVHRKPHSLFEQVTWAATKLSDFFTCASRVQYSHFCFGTHILNLSESQDSRSYSGKFCNGRNDFLVGLTLYSPSKSWEA